LVKTCNDIGLKLGCDNNALKYYEALEYEIEKKGLKCSRIGEFKVKYSDIILPSIYFDYLLANNEVIVQFISNDLTNHELNEQKMRMTLQSSKINNGIIVYCTKSAVDIRQITNDRQ
jgi:GxxExxY protein